MNPSDDKKFLELLEKWMRGDFTRADEQALKMLSEADDFRKEAMEGFMAVPEADHAARLESLRHRLSGAPARTGRQVSIGMRILAAAAVLALLVTAVVFYPVWKTAPEDTLAQHAPAAEPAPAAPAPAAESMDSATAEELAATSSTRPSAYDQPARSPVTRARPVPDAEIKRDKMAVRENEIALEERKESLPAAAPPTTAAAPPRPATTRPDVPEDEMGRRDVALEQDRQNKTVPQAAKQKAAGKKSEAAGAARYQTSSVESGPEGGWEAFRTYLYSTARLSPEARNNNVSGQVTLQLTLGPNGEVEDVKVLKGLGYGCDEAAIRLARSWKWIRGAQPRVTFDVPFVR